MSAENTHRGLWLLVLIIRWATRLIAAFLGAMLLLFIVGEGPPPPSILVRWLVVLAAFVLGWKYEGLAGVLLLAMFVGFNVTEYRANGRLLRLGAFHLLLVPAAGFLFCWVMERVKTHRVHATPSAPTGNGETP